MPHPSIEITEAQSFSQQANSTNLYFTLCNAKTRKRGANSENKDYGKVPRPAKGSIYNVQHEVHKPEPAPCSDKKHTWFPRPIQTNVNLLINETPHPSDRAAVICEPHFYRSLASSHSSPASSSSASSSPSSYLLKWSTLNFHFPFMGSYETNSAPWSMAFLFSISLYFAICGPSMYCFAVFLSRHFILRELPLLAYWDFVPQGPSCCRP